MNTQPLGWTTIDQSKKLIEAGLDPNTADMYYDTDAHGNKFGPFILIDRSYKEESDRFPELTQPCWSLAALLEVLPSATLDSSDDHHYRLRCVERFSEWYDNPIDTCMEMINRLHEQMVHDFNNS